MSILKKHSNKGILAIASFFLAIGGAFASYASGTVGWVATNSSPNGIRQAFSNTYCSLTIVQIICTEGSNSDFPHNSPNGKIIYSDPYQVGNPAFLLYELGPEWY